MRQFFHRHAENQYHNGFENLHLLDLKKEFYRKGKCYSSISFYFFIVCPLHWGGRCFDQARHVYETWT